MAVVFGPHGYYVCLAADSKPSPARQGILLLETDTGNWFMWDSSSWRAYTAPLVNVRP